MATSDTHKALTLPAVGTPFEVRTVPTPSPVAGSAVVQVLSAVIGPNRSEMYDGTGGVLTFPTPFVPGESAICRVVSVGPDAVLVKPGDLVLIDPFVAARDDPTGSQILFGLFDGTSPATKRLFAETWRDGLWAETCRVPLENCVVLNEEILMKKMGYSATNLAYLTRMAVGYGGVKGVDLRPGQTVIISPSTGQFSGATVEMASAMGAHVIALGRSPEKLARLKQKVQRVETITTTGDADADTAAIQKVLGNAGADAYIDLSPPHLSNPPYMAAAMRCLRANGRVAFLGMPQDMRIESAVLLLKNITIKGQYMYGRDDIRYLVRMAETGMVKLGSDAGHIVAGEFKLEDWEEALKTAKENDEHGRIVTFTP